MAILIIEVELLGELRFKLEIDLLEDVEDMRGDELVCKGETFGGAARAASMLCGVEIVRRREVGREEKSLV